jgi:hypothetical protein
MQLCTNLRTIASSDRQTGSAEPKGRQDKINGAAAMKVEASRKIVF